MRIEIVGLALALLLLAGTDGAEAAKRCRLLCRDQVRACVADARSRNVCTDLRGTERRVCRRTLRGEIRTCKSLHGPILAACKTSDRADTCSPSGAFLDGDVAGR
jgi:hypothetical protein